MICPGEIIDNTYQVCSEIGTGGMGVIYLALHLRLNKYVVLKKLKNADKDLSEMRNEVDVLKSLRHTYLPQVYDFIEYKGELFTIIDYIEGYDLKYYINNGFAFTQGQLIKWLRQLCEVLGYLHRHQPRILHLDIKPANIIIQSNGDICLIDFGISALGNVPLKGISYDYSSPEQYYNACCINEGRYADMIELDERTDLYSLGATFYEIITGLKPSCLYALQPCYPHARMNVSEALCRIIDIAVSYDREDRCSDAAEMLKAIDGIFKLSRKYQQYILIQSVGSALACLLIFLGGYLILTGINANTRSAFEADYDAYLAALNSDDTTAAASQAKKLINDSGYRSLMDEDTTAEVYHGLGGVYYDKGDYLNASDCYQKAVQTVKDSDKGELYYRDYAVSLIAQERYDDAKDILAALLEHYPDSPSGYLISAHLSYKEKDLKQARELIGKAITQSSDSETLYAAYLLSGDIASGEGELTEAADAYRRAIDAKQTAQSYRKLGLVLMKHGAADRTVSYYNDALDAYRMIYDEFTPTDDDVFNLAQCYLLSSDPAGAKKCMELLEGYVTEEPDSCRSYILLAIAAHADGDDHAAEYARKAHSIYVQMSDDERSSVDKESLSQIKKIYKRYSGEEW